MRVAIQGIEGSFHHLAAMRYLTDENIEVVGNKNFRGVFDSLKNEEADMACVAIENAIYGSLYENYDLLKEYGFHIVGEIFLKINHNLLALPDVKIGEIKKVVSHPVALKQCDRFLFEHNFQLEEYDDTASAAAHIAEQGLTDTAAIASAAAGEMYGLQSLATGIQDQHNNYTRFLFLSKTPRNGASNKLSLNFQIKNQSGALLNILQIIADFEGNMSKIESRPILGEVWQYQFYIDVTIDPQKAGDLIAALEKATKELTILGRYKEGQFVE